MISILQDQLMPVVLQLLSAVIGLMIARAANMARDRWGIEIEATHRAALQSAIMSGLSSALNRGLKGEDVIDAAIEHVHSSVPDAVRALKPAHGVLERIVLARLQDAQPLVTITTTPETTSVPARR